MATNAERQRAYRQRHLQDVDSIGARLNLVVSVQAKAQLGRLARHHLGGEVRRRVRTTAKAQLGRLARHHGVSQRAMLERLLAEAEQAAAGAAGYFD